MEGGRRGPGDAPPRSAAGAAGGDVDGDDGPGADEHGPGRPILRTARALMDTGDRYQGENLVFLVGCPRSGTTWLQRLLAAHPRVRTGQESHLFDFYIGPQLRVWNKLLDPEETGRGGVGIGCYLTEEEFLATLRRYMISLLAPMLRRVAPGELFLEKTPEHALYIPEILQLLPRARFVHLLRDPRDVVASLLAASESWGARWAPHSPWRAARIWVKHVRGARMGAATLGPSQFLEIRYEELHERPGETLLRVSGFLGLPWPRAEMEQAIENNRADRVRQGGGTQIPIRGAFSNPRGVVVEPDGFVRRAVPGGWRQDLSWSQKLVVRAVAADLMADVGYAR
jgi:hypothetical protein